MLHFGVALRPKASHRIRTESAIEYYVLVIADVCCGHIGLDLFSDATKSEEYDIFQIDRIYEAKYKYLLTQRELDE